MKNNHFLSLIYLKISTLLFLTTVFVIPPLVAQEVPYTPFPKGNISWQIWGDHFSKKYDCSFVLTMDTVLITIDNKVYSKVFFEKSEINDPIIVGGVREENKKIFLNIPELGEHLIYDFDLAIGDTLFNTLNAIIDLEWYVDIFKVGFYEPTELTINIFYVAKDKGFIILDNGERRNTLIVDKYVAYDYPYYEHWGSVEWIEGLGILDGRGGFLGVINVADDFRTRFYLGCICQSNTLLYSDDNLECALCNGNKINDNLQQQITLYPNPTTGELRIENGELRIDNVDMFDVYGRKLYLSTRPLVHSSTVNIDISHLQNGVYFVKIYTEAGVVTKKVIKN